jgi:NADPH:quinone reductase-like Zn-dependent oxidoreductase
MPTTPPPVDPASDAATEPAMTMQAVVQHGYGGTDHWQIADIDRPSIADDEVLVEVRAAGLDRGTWHLMAGLPYLVRPMFGLRTPRNPVPGLDVAGVVVAVGDGVTRFRPGDEVFGIAKGSFARYAAAEEAKLAPKPAGCSFEQAAVVAVSGLTALQAVRDQARITPGQRVLVLGASGGVGTYAVQIAKAFGAEVTGVASTAKLDLVRALGADHVIDYTDEDPTAGDVRYDAILDVGGMTPLRRLRRALTADGTLVIVGGEGGDRLIGGVDRQLRARLWSPFVGQRLTSFISKETADDLVPLAEMIDEGAVTPALERTYPLADARSAMDQLIDGTVRGKLALVP